MNRKLRPTKSVQQLKDEQIGLMLKDIEKDIEKFKITISEKNPQLYNVKSISKAATNSYQQVTDEQLKQYIMAIHLQQQQQEHQQHNNNNNCTFLGHKSIKRLFTTRPHTVTYKKTNKKHM